MAWWNRKRAEPAETQPEVPHELQFEPISPTDAFPYETLLADGPTALALFNEARNQSAETGITSVLLVDDEILNSAREGANGACPQRVAEIIEAAQAIDGKLWLEEQLRRDVSLLAEPGFVGSWEDDFGCKPGLDHYQFHSLGKNKLAKFYVVKLPTRNAWEIAAYLNMGGWNACPEPAVHVAVARYWHERFSATPVLAAFDTLEYSVSRPPATRDASLALAKEHHAYCSDATGTTGNLTGLAFLLENQPIWQFWWD